MIVHVRLFARARDLAGTDVLRVELPDGATISDLRRRLAADPSLLPTAIEEVLRAYAPVTMARMAKKDMQWRGATMKADDWILLS